MSVSSKKAKEAPRVIHLVSRDQWSGELTVGKASTARKEQIGDHPKSTAASDIRASEPIGSNLLVDDCELSRWANSCIDFC